MNVTADPILAFRNELRDAALRRISARRRRRLVLVAMLVVGALVTGFSIAGTGWLVGQPAPKPVVEDFTSYTPQLGFHPQPGKAVFVAQDGAIKLYATTNKEGTYCLIVDEPWKPPQAGDGGVCVTKAKAELPISAGNLGLSAVSDEGMVTYVLAGRVNIEDARTIRFTDPTGSPVERAIGSSGFYVAALRINLEKTFPISRPEGMVCPGKDWEPTFVALGSDGRRLLESKITLVHFDRNLCVFGGEVTPHGPYPSGP